MTKNKHNLPDSWRVFLLEEIVKREKNTIKRGPFGSALKKEFFINHGYKIYEQKNVIYNDFTIGNYYIDQQRFNELKDFEIHSGDILMSCSGTIGKLAKVPENIEKGIINQALLKLTLDSQIVDSDYFIYLFGSDIFQQTITDNTYGSAIKNIASVKVLKKISIPLPPIDEQKRIASILNEQMSAVERARKATEAQLESALALPSAYLRSHFHSEEAKSWIKKPFGEIATLQRGYDLPKSLQIDGKYPIVMSSGVNGTHHEYKAKAPGVVTGRSGSIGKVYYIEKDFFPHNTSLFVKDFQGNYPLYVYFLLLWMDVKSVCSGTGVPTLDRKQVHSMIVPYLNNYERQREIAIELNEKMRECEKLKQALQEQLETVNQLPSALLRRAFRGEL